MIEVILWSLLCMVLYTYVIYPAIMIILPKRRKTASLHPSVEYFPSVSVIIAAYNEESIINERIKNLYELGYPEGKIEFIIGSDGSDDHTNEILRSFILPNLHIELFSVRRGKANVINDLINKANGELIIFSDANTMYEKTTVYSLVKHFNYPSVGAVCGDLRLHTNITTASEIGESWYWRYENFLKRMESNFSTLIGATGAVYAIRKSLYKPLPTSKTVMDDFLIPLEIVKKGFRVVYEPDAVAYENAAGTVSREFRRKVRIGAANFNGISEFISLLHPRYGFVAFALLSHKIIRWFVPFLLLGVFIANVVLSLTSEFYMWLLFAQLGFIIFGLLGFILEKFKLNIGILSFPYYFIAMNLALFIGFLSSILGRQKPTWDIIR